MAETIINSIFVTIDEDGECMVFNLKAKSTLDFLNSQRYILCRPSGIDVHVDDDTIKLINEWALNNGYKGD